MEGNYVTGEPECSMGTKWKGGAEMEEEGSNCIGKAL
jgi:hypothetical protein